MNSVQRTLRTVALSTLASATVAAAILMPAAAQAKGGEPESGGGDTGACSGGRFSLVLPGRTVSTTGTQDLRTTLSAADLGSGFLVKGRYVEFGVVSSTLGVTDWTATGAPNALDITGGRRTVAFASKTPDLRGSVLSGGLTVRLREGVLRLERAGGGVAMKIQAKDCAQGGIFQMEVERADGTPTVFTHTLAPSSFYYDNPRFRERIGTTVPFVTDAGTTVPMPVTARVNFGNDASPTFVGRDSAQLATRVDQGCRNAFGTHCGGVSQWKVASGGRMGQVMGEDATEVSPAATDCASDCQAQNQVNGRATVLGFPNPVPTASRLTPRLP
jgi:hypothetical protein